MWKRLCASVCTSPTVLLSSRTVSRMSNVAIMMSVNQGIIWSNSSHWVECSSNEELHDGGAVLEFGGTGVTCVLVTLFNS